MAGTRENKLKQPQFTPGGSFLVCIPTVLPSEMLREIDYKKNSTDPQAMR